jgi:prepilin-type N-terminal cleavage/methylation domain-containing protein
MNCAFKARSRGFSLLELVIATAIMAAVVTAAASLLRTSQSVWAAHDGDAAKLDAAHATALHIVRQLRQCTSISAITPAAQTDGSISAVNGSGQTIVWSRVGSQVRYGVTTATNVLSDGISQLRFTGFMADGTTTTTTVGDIQSVLVTVVVTLDRDTNATKTISSRVWLRAW